MHVIAVLHEQAIVFQSGHQFLIQWNTGQVKEGEIDNSKIVIIDACNEYLTVFIWINIVQKKLKREYF